MPAWLDSFESIGENCEIGFVQRDLGHHASSLLRWAMLDGVEAMTNGLQTGYEGVFAFENLVPTAATMVRDVTAGVAFHTEIRAVMQDGVWRFTTPEEERREIHAREWRKFKYLRSRFRHDLLTGDRIYIVKRNGGLSEHDAELLLDAIASWGSGRLLYVTLSDETHPAGSVERVDSRVVHGRVDRFAPFSHADHVSLASWEQVLRGAAACFGVDGGPRRSPVDLASTMAPSAIDTDPTRPDPTRPDPARAGAAQPGPARPDRFAKTYAALTEAIADAVDGQKERNALLAKLDQAQQALAATQARCAEATAHAHASDRHVQTLDRMVQDLLRTTRAIVGVQGTALEERARLLELARWLARRGVVLGLLRRAPEQRLAIIRERAAGVGVGPELTEEALHWVARRRTLAGLLRRTSSFAQAIVNEALVRHAEAARIRKTQDLAAKH